MDKKEKSIILTTKSGIKIFEHNDTLNKNNKTTKYLCGHVFRIITDLKYSYNLKISAFIHIPLLAIEEDFFELLGICIKAYYKSLNKENVSIMISGFTKFQGVPDNPTSRFLFDDGTSENYGLINANIFKIKNMMENTFENVKLNKTILDNKNREIGLSFDYKNSIINLTFLRLPVDDDLTSNVEKEIILNKGTIYESKIINYPGDNTGMILKNSIIEIKPDGIISFGASKNLSAKEYHVENQAYGMMEKGALYKTQEEYVVNNDLSDLLKIISFC